MNHTKIYGTLGIVIIGGMIIYDTSHKLENNKDFIFPQKEIAQLLLAGTNTGSLTASSYNQEVNHKSALNFFHNIPLYDFELNCIKSEQEQNPLS